MPLRHQLAAYSPITAGGLARELRAALGLGRDPREALLALLGRAYAAEAGLLCGSGTQALQLAIGVATRGEPATIVALPAFTCYDVASAAIGAGVRVALYDVDPETLLPDLESLDRVLSRGARVAVIAPLYGVAADWDLVESVAARHGAMVIEDAAMGHGGSWRGQRLGALASISTLSFGRGKGWTGGGGGAVLLRGRQSGAAHSVVLTPSERELATVIASAAQWGLGRPAIYGVPRSIPGLGLGVTTYHAPVTPSAMPRAAAGGILAHEALSTREAEFRRANANELIERLADAPSVRIPRVQSDVTPGFLRLPARARDAATRDRFLSEGRRLGLEASYPTTLAELDPLRPLLIDGAVSCPGARALANELFTIPTHSRLSRRERAALVQLLRA